MSLSLQEAIERAELMATQNGELKQDSYNLLLHQLDDVDAYPFTIALVERGLSVRTGSKEQDKFREIVYGTENERGVELDKAEEKVAEAARKFAQQYRQTPGGLYMPETYFEEPEQEDDTVDLGEDDTFELVDSDIQFIGEPEDVTELQEKLETLGISIDQDGNAIFYKSNIPGLYKDQTKDKPISLDSAWNKYNTYIQGIDMDQSKVNGLLETLSGINVAIDRLEKFKTSPLTKTYDPNSKNSDVAQIGDYLLEVQSSIVEGDFEGAKDQIRSVQGLLEQRTDTKRQDYEKYVEALEVLDELIDMRDYDPEAFAQITQNLGGVSYPEKKKEAPKQTARRRARIRSVA